MKETKKKFYTVAIGEHLDSYSKRHFFNGFDTEEEAQAYADACNKDFMKDYSSEEAYLNDDHSSQVIVIKQEELDQYLNPLEEESDDEELMP